jgi:hypothetical protein
MGSAPQPILRAGALISAAIGMCVAGVVLLGGAFLPERAASQASAPATTTTAAPATTTSTAPATFELVVLAVGYDWRVEFDVAAANSPVVDIAALGPDGAPLATRAAGLGWTCTAGLTARCQAKVGATLGSISVHAAGATTVSVTADGVDPATGEHHTQTVIR